MTLPSADSALGQLMATLPRAGRMAWLGLRPERMVPMSDVAEAVAETGAGLVGDRYTSSKAARCASAMRSPPCRSDWTA